MHRGTKKRDLFSQTGSPINDYRKNTLYYIYKDFGRNKVEKKKEADFHKRAFPMNDIKQLSHDN